MTSPRKTVLIDTRTDEGVDALAVRGLSSISRKDLQAYYTASKSLTPKERNDAGYWDWDEIEKRSEGVSNAEIWVIEVLMTVANGYPVTQGAMLLSDGISPVTKKGLVEVHFLASAPHNRSKKIWLFTTKAGIFRGTGTVLLDVAKQRSIELGFGGTIGLHSYKNAKRFYEKAIGLKYYPGYEVGVRELAYYEGIP